MFSRSKLRDKITLWLSGSFVPIQTLGGICFFTCSSSFRRRLRQRNNEIKTTEPYILCCNSPVCMVTQSMTHCLSDSATTYPVRLQQTLAVMPKHYVIHALVLADSLPGHLGHGVTVLYPLVIDSYAVKKIPQPAGFLKSRVLQTHCSSTERQCLRLDTAEHCTV